MTKYMLSLHTSQGEAGASMTEEERKQSWKEIQDLNDELRSAGAWLFGGALDTPDTATVVRKSGGRVLTTDGPFAESKEQLGGFYIIEAENLDAALEWASKASGAVRRPIEVRPLRDGEA
jgi:hypothetical protein